VRRVFDYKVPQPAGTIPPSTFLSQQTRFEFDCNGGRVRTLMLVAQPENMGNGDVVSAWRPHGEWEPIAHGEAIEIAWNLACGNLKMYIH
jgi:hypothetical protein